MDGHNLIIEGRGEDYSYASKPNSWILGLENTRHLGRRAQRSAEINIRPIISYFDYGHAPPLRFAAPRVAFCCEKFITKNYFTQSTPDPGPGPSPRPAAE